MFGISIKDQLNYNNVTATAGTVIRQIIKPWKGCKTAIMEFSYLDSGTAHTLSLRMALGKSALAASVAASATSLMLDANLLKYGTQKPIQTVTTANPVFVYGQQDSSGVTRATTSSDYIIAERFNDGIKEYDLISCTGPISNGALPVSAIPNALGLGARLWLMSVTSDAIPGRQLANPVWTSGAASSYTTFPKGNIVFLPGVAVTPGYDEPMYFQSNNATNAGTFVEIIAAGIQYAAGSTQQTF